jgi:Winged helix DNA-binding domain
MLRLLTPRVISGSAWRARQLELDEAVFAKSRKVFEKALRDGAVLTRPEMYEVLERARISTAGQRGIHILSQLSQQGLLCFAPHQGKQPAFALLDEWILESRSLERDEALAELTERYFRGHGPATLRDFAWWSGLTLTDARAGLAAISTVLTERVVNGVTYIMSRDAPDLATAKRSVHLLPGFDEYMLGYADRSIALQPAHAQAIVPGNNGMFMPTIVAGGRVVGTWRAALSGRKAAVGVTPFAALSGRDNRALAAATKRYQRFLATPPIR